MSEPPVDALELFVEWLSRRESDNAIAFEQLLQTHAGLAKDLESLHASWKELASASDLSAASLTPNPNPSPIPIGRATGWRDSAPAPRRSFSHRRPAVPGGAFHSPPSAAEVPSLPRSMS